MQINEMTDGCVRLVDPQGLTLSISGKGTSENEPQKTQEFTKKKETISEAYGLT